MPKADSNKSSAIRFRSRSEHTLDAKGRLNIPSRFRDVLQSHGNEQLMVTNWHKCLKAFPVKIWERIETTLLVQGKKQVGMDSFRRYVISGVTECTLDKQGRILLPPTLRTDFDFKKNVVLNGMLDHFEIWDKAAWEKERKQTRDTFSDFEKSLSALGIL
ncbi:MAG: division/cell wall cluster transcriptional repressor MraZ [Desulfobulbales bacterium]|nr:division/cell wall cluster transcriptional repressor MraZ [Desulfobulbales bacterium]